MMIADENQHLPPDASTTIFGRETPLAGTARFGKRNLSRSFVCPLLDYTTSSSLYRTPNHMSNRTAFLLHDPFLKSLCSVISTLGTDSQPIGATSGEYPKPRWEVQTGHTGIVTSRTFGLVLRGPAGGWRWCWQKECAPDFALMLFLPCQSHPICCRRSGFEPNWKRQSPTSYLYVWVFV